MLTMFDPRQIPTLRQDIIRRDEGNGELLLYNPDTDQLHLVKGLGRLVVERCTGRDTLAAIISDLSASHQELATPYGQACLGRFVRELLERDLLQAVSA